MQQSAEKTHAVGIGEKTDTGHDGKSNVIPSKRRFVDFGEGHAPPLVGVANVSLCGLAVAWQDVNHTTYIDARSIVVCRIANALLERRFTHVYLVSSDVGSDGPQSPSFEISWVGRKVGCTGRQDLGYVARARANEG